MGERLTDRQEQDIWDRAHHAREQGWLAPFAADVLALLVEIDALRQERDEGREREACARVVAHRASLYSPGGKACLLLTSAAAAIRERGEDASK